MKLGSRSLGRGRYRYSLLCEIDGCAAPSKKQLKKTKGMVGCKTIIRLVKTGVVLGNRLKRTSFFYIKKWPLIKCISSVRLLSAAFLHTFTAVHSSRLTPNERTPD